MIIAVDHHVGLPFLEGLCADLQDQIQLRAIGRKIEKMPSISVTIPRWQRIASRGATLACGVAGALIALLELGSTL
jgi:hypothetical protein